LLKIVGERLKQLRESREFKFKYIAEKIGVTPGAISNYEKLLREPDVETLMKFADLYNVSLDYILGIDGIEDNKQFDTHNLITAKREERNLVENDIALSLGIPVKMVINAEKGLPIPNKILKSIYNYLKIEVPNDSEKTQIVDEVQRFINNPDNAKYIELAMYIKTKEVPILIVKEWIDINSN